VQFVESIPQKVVAPPAKPEIDPSEAALEGAEGLYEQGDYDHARDAFKQVLQRTADKSLQGRAYYGLARIAVHENQKDEAVTLFERTAEFNPDPAITAWSHVYLGRLALASGKPEKAAEQFKAALAIEGASAMAREAAEKGLESTSSSGEKQP
jgi:predicted negative regulator of RcsB-dependent stress response